MKIADYVQQARSTAIYHEKSPLANFTYPALGLAGEIGEAIDKIEPIPLYAAATKLDIIEELGDVLWYVVNVPLDADFVFDDIVHSLVGQRVDDFVELGLMLKLSEDTRPAILKLPIYAGRIAEIAKKMIRDSSGVIPTEKLHVIGDSIGEIIVCLYEICQRLGIDMNDVAQTNIDKLFSRKSRGCLQGSGDKR
jgi:NTP pyrophosphatase (non-canonical NTP hydrolase)